MKAKPDPATGVPTIGSAGSFGMRFDRPSRKFVLAIRSGVHQLDVRLSPDQAKALAETILELCEMHGSGGVAPTIIVPGGRGVL